MPERGERGLLWGEVCVLRSQGGQGWCVRAAACSGAAQRRGIFCQHPSLCTRMWLCQECTLWFLYRPAALSEQRASLTSAKMAFLMQMLSVRERSVMLGAVCL